MPVKKSTSIKNGSDKKKDFHQLNMHIKEDDMKILRSLANHHSWSMTKVIVTLLRKTGAPRGRPKSISVGKI